MAKAAEHAATTAARRFFRQERIGDIITGGYLVAYFIHGLPSTYGIGTVYGTKPNLAKWSGDFRLLPMFHWFTGGT